MQILSLQKGNLFNQLDGKIDPRLLDASQYDLKISDGITEECYRVRYAASYLDAVWIPITDFQPSRYSRYGVPIEEVANFRYTDTFKNPNFPYRQKFIENLRQARDVPPYYAFLQRATSKNNINKSGTLYNFSVPTIGNRQKSGVLSYDISIELVKEKFYIIFFKERVEKGYIQRESVEHFVYDQRDFDEIRSELSDAIIDLAIEEDCPVNITQYVYLMTGRDSELTHKLLQYLRRAQNLEELLHTPFFLVMKDNIKNDETLKRELARYLSREQDDIDYSYDNKMLCLNLQTESKK